MKRQENNFIVIAILWILSVTFSAYSFSAGANAYELYMAGRISEAVGAYEVAAKEVKKADSPMLEAKYYFNIGHILFNLGDLESSSKYLLKSLNIYRNLDYSKGMALVYTEQGKQLLLSGDIDSALGLFGKSKDIFSKIKDRKGEMLVLNEMGLAYIKNGDYNTARECFLKAYNFNKKKNLKAAASNMNNIGSSYLKEDNLLLAEEYLLKALKLDEKCGNVNNRAVTLINISHIYQLQNKCAKSLFYLKRASSIGLSPYLKNKAEKIANSCNSSL